MPIVTETTDSTASLSRLQDSIDYLRHALNKCAIRHSQLKHQQKTGTTLPLSSTGPTEENTSSDKELETLSTQALSHTVCVKLAHDAIIHDVDVSRTTMKHTQDELVKERLRLDNLRYEKLILLQEISVCRNVSSPLLQKTKVPLPVTLFNSNATDAANADDVMIKNLKDVDTSLHDELTARRKLQTEVENVIMETARKKKKLAKMKYSLRKVPLDVKAVYDVVQPIRLSMAQGRSSKSEVKGSIEGNGIGSKSELEMIAKLPLHMYIMAREAVAYREAFDSNMSVHIIPESDDAITTEGIYKSCGMCVVIEVGQSTNLSADTLDVDNADMVNIMDTGGARLKVVFRYLEKLGIVVVRGIIISDGQECDEYPTKELKTLYPRDKGDISPRAEHAHLENGTFIFDVTKAKGRAFIWANVLCGIECMPKIIPKKRKRSSEEVGIGMGWPSEMGGMMTHLRFSEVATTLKQRLASIVHVKRQVDWLMGKRQVNGDAVDNGMVVKASDMGLIIESDEACSARVDDFVRLGRKEWKSQGLLIRDDGIDDDVDVDDMEVWSMRVVGGQGMMVSCMVAVEVGYPLARPVFRLKFEGGVDGVTERDITDMERSVNEVDIKDKLKGRIELTLGAQVTRLLTLVDGTRGRVCRKGEERA